MQNSVENSQPVNTSRRRVYRIGAIFVLGFLALMFLGITWRGRTFSAQRLLEQARHAAWEGNQEKALELANQALGAMPDFNEAHLFAAETAMRLQRSSIALEHVQSIARGTPEAAMARRMAGALQLEEGRAIAAEKSFLDALVENPDDDDSRIKLMTLLRLEGRNRELAEHVKYLLKKGDCPAEFLFALAWPDRIWMDSEDLKLVNRYRQQPSSDPLMEMGSALQSVLTEEMLDNAVRVLKQIRAGEFIPVEVHARLGTLLADAGRWNEVTEWEAQLPPAASEHPQIWFIRGLNALQSGDVEQAFRFFCSTLERSPHHGGAIHQLAGLLTGTRRSDLVSELHAMSKLLNDLRQNVVVGKGQGGNPDGETLDEIASLLESLGRDWEAYGWSRMRVGRHGNSPASKERLQRLKLRLAESTPMVTAIGDITQRKEWKTISGLTRSEINGSVERANSQMQDGHPGITSHIQFAEVSQDAGINFRFQQRKAAMPPVGYMFEISAGGVGVLDFDVDGWPDVYLSQGCEWPPGSQRDEPMDQLFRNQLGQSFTEVAQSAAIAEGDYGQGVTIGDFNNDGFPDVLVLNIGGSRLWINQGDGTFTSSPTVEKLTRRVWSMSAAMADLNGDSNPDLFVVNYLGGDALSRICDRDGHPVQCRPTMFPGEQNQLLISDGQGGFVDVTQGSGIVNSDGKGMGIVVADFECNGKLHVYVSNDTTENSYFQNETSGVGEVPHFVEHAALMGNGVGENGQPQASMGIAADDANRDGRIDLLVTNFTSQASNLFVQQPTGGFVDLARSWRIYDKSFHRMGWGTQFLDADLDGDPDLIVANGHLEDYSRFGVASRMSTQFFRNVNGQRFEELKAESLGPYFAEQNLGRVVARWDWNRDGREEAIITHVDRRASLLRNDTQAAGHHLSVRLVSTSTARDAIGARVIVDTGRRLLTRQLVAGDGFECSNQKQLVVGLGTHSENVAVRVLWPSGKQQQFSDVPIDREIVLIEGRDSPVLIGFEAH